MGDSKIVQRGTETVFTSVTTPLVVASTSTTTPLIIGGTTTTSDLKLKTTTANAASGADMTLCTGNNGALDALVINYDATTTIGNTTGSAALTAQCGTGAFTQTAGGIWDVNATGAVTIDSSATFSIDGTGNSNVTAAAGNLTLATTSSGNVVVNAAATVDIDGATSITLNAIGVDASSNVTGMGTLGCGAITSSGTLALAANSITMTGSLATTGSRVTKGWFTDLECTNAIAGSITGNAATLTVADTASATCYVGLYEAASGSLAGKTDAALTYNASTGALAATSLGVTGAVTGASSTWTTAGTAKAVTDMLTLTNSRHAADMDGTGIGILFNLYEDTTPAVWNAGRISVVTPNDVTSTASTQDADMIFSCALNGAVAEKARIGSDSTFQWHTSTDYGKLSWGSGYVSVGSSSALAFNAGSVTAEKARIDSSGNFGLGLTAFGTSAAKVLGLASGTAPTTSPADAVQMWSADRNAIAGTAGLHVRTENGNSYIFADVCGFGTVTPSTFSEFSHAGTATATYDMVALTNTVNAASMTATGTAILFNQWYYDAATPAVADAGRVAVITEGNWTSDSGTHDAKMSFQVALNGTVTEYMTLSSAGVVAAPFFRPTAGSGAAQDRAILMGVGTAADPSTWATADKSGVEFRIKGTATTGTTYGLYMGQEAATSAEHIAVRGRVLTTASSGNAHGGHFTLESDGTNGAITGLGTGLRANWVLGAAAEEAGGTYYGALAEIYANGEASSPAAVTRYAILGIGANGDATGAATIKNAIDFHSTGADASGNMIYSHDHAPGNAAGSIRILVDGAVRHLKFYAAE